MQKNIVFQEKRRYDIDWIRIMLIFSVFLFHIGMFFNTFGWHIKNNKTITWLNPLMAYLHVWRMPLLFFVSGVGTYYALGKRNILKYIGERSRKLLIPLLFGMFFIVPPQVFIEKHSQYGSYINFIPHIAEGSYPEGNLSWHHLWFILYLFICSAAALPIIFLFRSSFKSKIINVLSRYFRNPGSLLTLCIPLFLTKAILTRYFPWETHGLTDDWAFLTYSFIFFIYGFILFSDQSIIQQIIKQRRINGAVSLFLSIIFFIDYFHSVDPYISNTVQLFASSMLEWAIGITVIGYGGKYLNKDFPLRKYLNEAIYPFYILHQTVIIIIGFYLVNATIVTGVKAIILTLSSFFVSVIVYLVVIRPFNFIRVLFGMPSKKKEKSEGVNTEVLRAAS